jgi:restriction system protein
MPEPIDTRVTPETGGIALEGVSARIFGVFTPPSTLPSVNLLMQTVVEFGAKTDDGHLIQAVTLPWFAIVEALQKDPGMAFQMTPRMWEEMVAGAYERAGFDEVILTPRSGDLGRDVIAIKQGLGTIRVIDQVKAYGPGRLVDADDVRALFGVVIADRASKGFLTTTADFAPRLRQDPLIAEQIGPRIELVNGTQLLARLKELAKE